jgi:hypothetical protein
MRPARRARHAPSSTSPPVVRPRGGFRIGAGEGWVVGALHAATPRPLHRHDPFTASRSSARRRATAALRRRPNRAAVTSMREWRCAHRTDAARWMRRLEARSDPARREREPWQTRPMKPSTLWKPRRDERWLRTFPSSSLADPRRQRLQRRPQDLLEISSWSPEGLDARERTLGLRLAEAHLPQRAERLGHDTHVLRVGALAVRRSVGVNEAEIGHAVAFDADHPCVERMVVRPALCRPADYAA